MFPGESFSFFLLCSGYGGKLFISLIQYYQKSFLYIKFFFFLRMGLLCQFQISRTIIQVSNIYNIAFFFFFKPKLQIPANHAAKPMIARPSPPRLLFLNFITSFPFCHFCLTLLRRMDVIDVHRKKVFCKNWVQ